MLDGRTLMGQVSGMSVEGAQSKALRRGHLVVSGAATRTYLVWSFDQVWASCLPMGTRGPLFNHALAKRHRTTLVVVGTASPATLAVARNAVAALQERRFRGTIPDDDTEIEDVGRTPRHSGRAFWNGDDIAPGCSWTQKRLD